MSFNDLILLVLQNNSSHATLIRVNVKNEKFALGGVKTLETIVLS